MIFARRDEGYDQYPKYRISSGTREYSGVRRLAIGPRMKRWTTMLYARRDDVHDV